MNETEDVAGEVMAGVSVVVREVGVGSGEDNGGNDVDKKGSSGEGSGGDWIGRVMRRLSPVIIFFSFLS